MFNEDWHVNSFHGFLGELIKGIHSLGWMS